MFCKTNTDAAPRRRGGQRGNRNAVKHGRHTAEMRALRAEVRFLVAKTKALAKLAWCLELPPRSASRPADGVAREASAEHNEAPLDAAPPEMEERPPHTRSSARPASLHGSRLQRADVRRPALRFTAATVEPRRRQPRLCERAPPPCRRSQQPHPQGQQRRRAAAMHPRLRAVA